MLNWMKRRSPITPRQAEPEPEPQRGVGGKYRSLYTYLQNRYATTVVLTFGQIESLLGFALPEQARQNQEWWTNVEGTSAGSTYAACWILASRVATPNLLAQTVAFERAS